MSAEWKSGQETGNLTEDEIISVLHGVPLEAVKLARERNGGIVNFKVASDGKVTIDSPRKGLKERIRSLLRR